MSTTVPILATSQIFPQANIVAGVLVIVVGFGFHFLGQLYSVLNWDGATKLGLQEEDMPPEYKVYEHAIAVSDSLIGWAHGVAGIGLIAGADWGYLWAWVPGVVLTYHSLGFWFWTGNQKRAGYDRPLTRRPFRLIWFSANLSTGLLTIAVASSRITMS